MTKSELALSKAEREEFLAQPHIGALAIEAGDRGPLMVPMWYDYTPGGQVVLITGAYSRKTKLIQQCGRFSLMAERSAPTLRYVSVEGPVTEIRPATTAEEEAMARRYLGDGAAAYMEKAVDFGDQVRITMTPARWLSSDLGAS